MGSAWRPLNRAGINPAITPRPERIPAGGTPVYLLPDFADDNADQYVQTWDFDPTLGENATWAKWMLWHIEANSDGTYAIRSNPTRRYLTDPGGATMTMIKLAASGRDDQRWNIIPVVNAWAPHVYLVSPATRPEYA
ncbi:RICIN domain-containing protein [Nonomuraea basaltis]|uniref:RICIN domain-containing protein n=1 Tax=Nonomuraea basaltis TaxID=2495887 RepID=UPI00110C4253|nr:RICIN domain-containing protein [Nonomuraea basaltis]TMR97945.1 hypothetical protein EJK15_15730 [Nonomuraea basaltis]